MRAESTKVLFSKEVELGGRILVVELLEVQIWGTFDMRVIPRCHYKKIRCDICGRVDDNHLRDLKHKQVQ